MGKNTNPANKPKSSQKKIRDLQRLLRKLQSQSATVAVGGENEDSEQFKVKEDEIKEIQSRIDELNNVKETNILKEVKRKHETRYHMVKFFERKKVTRVIHKVIKQLKDIETELITVTDKAKKKECKRKKEQLEKKKKDVEDDLTYIMYYPIQMKYVALYANSERDASVWSSSQNNQSQSEGEDNEEDGGAAAATATTSRAVNNDKRLVLEGKALQSFEKAMQLAQEARQNEIADGKEDRVQHAIEVQLRGKAKKGEKSDTVSRSKSSNKRNDAQSRVEGEDSDADSSSARDDDDAEAAGVKSALKKRKHEDREESAAAAQDRSQKKSKKEDSNKRVESATEQPVASIAVDDNEDKDEFFLEEAGDADLADANRHTRPKVYRLSGSEIAGDADDFYSKKRDRNTNRNKDYHQIKQAVNKKKYIHHKGFSSKKSNFNKF